MALIKCPECDHNVSDKAEACPNCGFPISEYIVRDNSIQPSNETVLPVYNNKDVFEHSLETKYTNETNSISYESPKDEDTYDLFYWIYSIAAPFGLLLSAFSGNIFCILILWFFLIKDDNRLRAQGKNVKLIWAVLGLFLIPSVYVLARAKKTNKEKIAIIHFTIAILLVIFLTIMILINK